MEWDIDRELIALDTCLADFEHPLSPAVRKRALALAAGIVAGAPAPDRTAVATRLELTLRRHGITECCQPPSVATVAAGIEFRAPRADGEPQRTWEALNQPSVRHTPTQAR